MYSSSWDRRNPDLIKLIQTIHSLLQEDDVAKSKGAQVKRSAQSRIKRNRSSSLDLGGA